MEDEKKIRNILGLAMRAGKIASGETAVEAAVKKGKAFLVIVAEDASYNTEKKFSDKCMTYNVPLCRFGNKEELGDSLGKGLRSVVAVMDKGFAETVSDMINSNGGSACESK